MCGYIGKISNLQINNDSLENNNKRIICRGPDETININSTFSSLFKNDDQLNFNFIFNRLSIVDLGKNASQPMINKEKNTILMFNGEIYNHRELRKKLEQDGIKFYSDHSDSEVVLNGLTYFGNTFIEKLIGQFSIAFYRSDVKNLTLIRDRVGQKPLFYSNLNNEIVFGSNLISVSRESKLNNIDKNSLNDFLNYGVVPSSNTIFEKVYKLMPGEIINIDLKNIDSRKTSSIYWSFDKFNSNQKFDEDHFYDLVSNSINIREEADVKVANFLSGGLDSSFIVKNMYDRGKNINSYSVVLNDKKYDERKWSRKVSNKYNTNHIEVEIGLNDIEKYVLDSILAFDEPYADPSTIPSFIISNLISKNFKTAISGDGGDELVGGYKRTHELLQSRNPLKNLYKFLNKIYPNHLGTGNNFLKHSLDLKEATASYFSDKNFINFLGLEDNFTFEDKYYKNLNSDYKTLLNVEYSFYLSEMMMLKVDRTSMSNSLEVRSPFVDHRLIEYVFSTEPSYLLSNNKKSLFKNYLANDFDSSFLNRRKQGFVFNLEDWVYQNQNLILETILDVNLFSLFDHKKIFKLFKFKTRINALRIWKLFLISKYVDLNS